MSAGLYCIFGAIPEMKMSFTENTDTTPYLYKTGLWNLLLTTCWVYFFIFWSRVHCVCLLTNI